MDPVSRLAQACLKYGKIPLVVAILVAFFGVLITGSAFVAAVAWMFWPSPVSGSWKGTCLGGKALLVLEQSGGQLTGTGRSKEPAIR